MEHQQNEIKQSTPSIGSRPIILSPPLLDHHTQQQQQNPQQLQQNQQQHSQFPFASHSDILHSTSEPSLPINNQRQQSVGYNLQHEFETLTADLDLDLKYQLKQQQQGLVDDINDDDDESNFSLNQKSGFNSNLLAPSASKFSGGSDLLGNMSSLKESTLSPTPTSSSTRINSNSTGQSGQHQLHHRPQLPNLLEHNGAQFLGPPPLASVPNRPQSVNDFTNVFMNYEQQQQQQQQPHASTQLPSFSQTSAQQVFKDQSNFYSDLLVFSNWIENLNPQDTLVMIDYLCQSLPLDILLTFKSKLDLHLQAPKKTQPNATTSSSTFSDNNASNIYPQDLYIDMENLHLSKKQPPFKSSQYLNVNDKFNRPKSADPFYNQQIQQQQQFDRAKSPTSHLYEKTNFLQLAANNGGNPYNNLNHQDDSIQNALKLGALQTINSRVALDSNRKHPFQQHPQNFSHHMQSHSQQDINRSLNSSSVPASIQRSPFNSKKKKNSPDQLSSPVPTSANSTTSINSLNSSSSSSMPLEVSNIELLNNIPAWLKLLRLHKYTDCLKDVPWKELIELDNEQLEAKGVSALGARRKLLKAFDIVKGNNNNNEVF